MSRLTLAFEAPDISALARTLHQGIAALDRPPGHVELLNLLARGAGYRNFRVERIQSSTVLDEPFDQDNGRLFREWAELPKVKPTPSP